MNRVPHITVDELVKHETKQPYAVALPVWFHGFRFRSRLEGRWAVFFESIGMEFEYEPQGFRLQNRICYLPDFWFPRIKTFAEVKPVDPTPLEKLKCELTVRGAGGLFLILPGMPDFRAYTGISRDSGELTEEIYSLDIHAHHRAYFAERRLWSAPDFEDTAEDGCSERYREAVYAARSARFGRDGLPPIGREPFNASEGDIREAWRDS